MTSVTCRQTVRHSSGSVHFICLCGKEITQHQQMTSQCTSDISYTSGKCNGVLHIYQGDYQNTQSLFGPRQTFCPVNLQSFANILNSQRTFHCKMSDEYQNIFTPARNFVWRDQTPLALPDIFKKSSEFCIL